MGDFIKYTYLNTYSFVKLNLVNGDQRTFVGRYGVNVGIIDRDWFSEVHCREYV